MLDFHRRGAIVDPPHAVTADPTLLCQERVSQRVFVRVVVVVGIERLAMLSEIRRLSALRDRPHSFPSMKSRMVRMRVTSASVSRPFRRSCTNSFRASSNCCRGNYTGHLREQVPHLLCPRVRVHRLFQHPAGIHAVGVRRRIDLTVCDQLDPLVLDLADNQWRMSGRDELTARKSLTQVVDDLPLPLRVQVQIDLVDQHDRPGFGRWISESGISLGQPPGQVQYQR